MWGTNYISWVQEKLVVNYGFPRNEDGLPKDVPDGAYPMEITAGKLDLVLIKDGKVHCCNFIGTDEGLRQFQKDYRDKNDKT